MVIDHAMESMPISTTWDIVFPVHMSTNVRVPQKKPSVPDFFLETDGPGGNIALLILEVGFRRQKGSDEENPGIRYGMQEHTNNCHH